MSAEKELSSGDVAYLLLSDRTRLEVPSDENFFGILSKMKG